jgi:hypothetical protein
MKVRNKTKEIDSKLTKFIIYLILFIVIVFSFGIIFMNKSLLTILVFFSLVFLTLVLRLYKRFIDTPWEIEIFTLSTFIIALWHGVFFAFGYSILTLLLSSFIEGRWNYSFLVIQGLFLSIMITLTIFLNIFPIFYVGTIFFIIQSIFHLILYKWILSEGIGRSLIYSISNMLMNIILIFFVTKINLISYVL